MRFLLRLEVELASFLVCGAWGKCGACQRLRFYRYSVDTTGQPDPHYNGFPRLVPRKNRQLQLNVAVAVADKITEAVAQIQTMDRGWPSQMLSV